MRCCFRILLLLAFAASAPVFCYSEQPTPEELEANKRLLERWKSDPEHYARLQTDLRDFWKLPPERKEHLRQFDQELHDTDSVTQKRLYGVLERYGAWHERLPEHHQHRLDKSADRHERLQLIKQLREDQWLARQPKQVRDELAKLPDDKRHAEIAKQREEERKRIAAWVRATGGKVEPAPVAPSERPVRASDFPPEIERYINDVLKPQLDHEEREHLGRAEGKWPNYARLLIDLSDRHPVKLPGPTTGPSTYERLPREYQTLFKSPKDWPPGIFKAYGKWPDYAIVVTEAARKRDPNLAPLGPSHAADFAAPLKEFIETTLTAALTDQEKEELTKAEGRWPEYPRKIKELAEKHNLEVPGMKAPNLEKWREIIRTALPEVPDRVLRDFAINDLSPEERNKLNLSVGDPKSRERLVQEYFKKNPHDRDRLFEVREGRGNWPKKP
jgi:hypothetical protein